MMGSNMKALVTGGAGFIGSHLVDALLEMGIEVVVLDNFSTGRPENLNHIQSEKIKIVNCNIATYGEWSDEFSGVEWVFHLAALADIVPSIKNPGEYFESNVAGTLNVLRAAKLHAVKRFIYSASSSCYGIPDEYPTKENAEIRCLYPYALTKRLGEELVMHWASVYGIPALSLRFFNVYGPRSRTSGTYGAVFGVFLAQKLFNKPFTVVGDGEQTRDFTYVTDIASALVAAAKSTMSNQIYNIGSGRTISINHLVKLLEGEVVYIPKRPGEPDSTFADITKAKEELNWSPSMSIEDGVLAILQEINYWKDAPVWTPDAIKSETADWFKFLSRK